MILIIDGSNIRAGGGVTHLVKILEVAKPREHGFNKVIVCASVGTLSKINEQPWLEKHSHLYLEKGYWFRLLWRVIVLKALLKKNNALLFAVSTLGPGFRWPHVTICQNLLPLDLKELFRFGFSFVTLRLLSLRFLHLRAYRKADGVIFLTGYCLSKLPSPIRSKILNYRIIPHGLSHHQFYPIDRSLSKVFNLIYVSIVNVYKHQNNVAQAVIDLNKRGYYINLKLVGEVYPPSLKELEKVIDSAPEVSYSITHKSGITYMNMPEQYKDQDAFIFASTCETFGMIITEAMSMGMPIACSNKSSMYETLQDAGIYFDPENVDSIKKSILTLYQNEELRKSLSAKALERSKDFTWEKCSNDTFSFLAEIAVKYKMATLSNSN